MHLHRDVLSPAYQVLRLHHVRLAHHVTGKEILHQVVLLGLALFTVGSVPRPGPPPGCGRILNNGSPPTTAPINNNNTAAITRPFPQVPPSRCLNSILISGVSSVGTLPDTGLFVSCIAGQFLAIQPKQLAYVRKPRAYTSPEFFILAVF